MLIKGFYVAREIPQTHQARKRFLVSFQWAHISILGNEISDKLAITART